MKKCPSCGIITESKFCPECGTDLSSVDEYRVCPNCGTETNSKFCPECGTPIEQHISVDLDNASTSEQRGAAEIKASDNPENIVAPAAINAVNIGEAKKEKKKLSKKTVAIIVAVVVVLFMLVGLLGGKDSSTSEQTASEEPATEETVEETEPEPETEVSYADIFGSFTKEEDYESMNYDNLARNPDDYIGNLYKGSGKVLQVVEGDSEIDLRVAVNDDYDTVIYLVYDPSIVDSRTLEDDEVTFYGKSGGLYSYESTMGGTITIPIMYVHKITRD